MVNGLICQDNNNTSKNNSSYAPILYLTQMVALYGVSTPMRFFGW